MSSVCLGSSLGVRKPTSYSHSYNRGGIEVTEVELSFSSDAKASAPHRTQPSCFKRETMADHS